MGVLDKARQTAKSAAQSAAEIAADRGKAAAGSAGRATVKGASRVADWSQDPETHEKARHALAGAGRQAKEAAGAARRGVTTVIERIEPATLADVIIRATAIQERTNDALRRKGSLYRISEIDISASIPPGITFVIGRFGEEADIAGRASADLLGSEPEAPVLALDGSIDRDGGDDQTVAEDDASA